MQIRPFRGTFPDLLKLSPPIDTFFEAVRENYSDFARQHFYQQRPRAAFYLYRIGCADRNYTGLIACTAVEDYLSGKIKPHERTIDSKERQQIALLLQRKAAVKPVLLTYRQEKAVDDWLNSFTVVHEPFLVVNFSIENQVHQFWEVAAAVDIECLQELFRDKVPVTYVADGHHRLATVTDLYLEKKRQGSENPFQNVLCAYFPAGELEILDFNRVIDGLQGHTPAAFMEQLSTVFTIQPLSTPSKPVKKHEITMYLQQQWYTLQWKSAVLKNRENKPAILDIELLEDEVLNPILGILHPNRDPRIDYIEGPRGWQRVAAVVDQLSRGVGFCLYPISLQDMMILADQSQTLPAKSTWFEPRMKNGLVVLDLYK